MVEYLTRTLNTGGFDLDELPEIAFDDVRKALDALRVIRASIT